MQRSHMDTLLYSVFLVVKLQYCNQLLSWPNSLESQSQQEMILPEVIYRLPSIAVWVGLQSSRSMLISKSLQKYIGFRIRGLFRLQHPNLRSFRYTASIYTELPSWNCPDGTSSDAYQLALGTRPLSLIPALGVYVTATARFTGSDVSDHQTN